MKALRADIQTRLSETRIEIAPLDVTDFAEVGRSFSVT